MRENDQGKNLQTCPMFLFLTWPIVIKMSLWPLPVVVFAPLGFFFFWPSATKYRLYRSESFLPSCIS